MTNIPRYQFCEIPNTPEGWALVNSMKKYLNKQGYKLRVKGQHMDAVAKANWRYYERGQPISRSTHLRVYLDDIR